MEGEPLRLDQPIDLVILLQLNDPLTEAFCREGCMGDPIRLEVVIGKELVLDLAHNVVWNVILVDGLQLGHKVFLIHKLLCSVPPVFFELLRIVLLGSFLDLTV